MTAGEYWYRAHGLTIRADVPIPELAPAGERAPSDLRILTDPAGPLPPTPPPGSAITGHGQAYDGVWLERMAAGDLTLSIEGVGRFRVRGGSQIRVAPVPGCDPSLITIYTVGSAMGLALMQRGALVLHGAGVLTDDGAALILGPSGIGKSTLAAALARRGLPSLGDDTVALWPGQAPGGLVAFPAIHAFKLWKDALDVSGTPTTDLARLAERFDKYYLPNPCAAPDRAHGLSAVYLLKDQAGDGPARIEPLGVLQAVKAVGDNVYRPGLVDALDLTGAQFQQICALVEQVPVARLLRPRTHAANDQVAALLGA